MAKLLRRYSKKSKYSLCFGVYPTIELLERRPESIQSIFIRTDAEKNGGARKIIDFCRAHRIAYHINNRAIVHATGKENIYALAVFLKFESKIENGANHVVLVHPGDAGNVGTIIRTLLAFGIKDLAIIRPGVDVFHPETVRSSMGSLFSIRFEYFETFEQYTEQHTNKRYFFTTDGTDIMHIAFQKPYALVFGSEAAGLPGEILGSETRVLIPQTSDVDSLNLAVSLGIGVFFAQHPKPLTTRVR